jgi:hypothetical protein
MKMYCIKVLHQLQPKVEMYDNRMTSFIIFLERNQLKLKLKENLIAKKFLLENPEIADGGSLPIL